MTAADRHLPFKYCPSCGERVYTYTVQREDGIELRCSACGFPLSLETEPPLRGLECIMIADDDRLFRSILADLLEDRGLATTVVACENGTTFLTAAADRFRQKLSIKLAILDIIMQPIDGVATAMALRSLEKGMQVAQPTPILFLSAVRLDDALGKLITQCRPAIYLNKASDATPAQLGPRLDKVIGFLLERGRK